MTLKELRIKKGLNQEDCAAYLGISRRTYQMYENDINKVGTSKYNTFYQLLEQKQTGDFHFNTPVIKGEKIDALVNKVKGYQKRDCFSLLEKFMKDDYRGKICALYGLRRTGKTTLLFQLLETLPKEKSAYIKVRTTDTMAGLTKDLEVLLKEGIQYVFIDEITLLEDFINTAAILSDIYSMLGLKIIVSGTDSLGFEMASRDELYDRCIMIHTSYIPFSEYERILGIHSIDQYIEFGGTLKIENMTFSDEDRNSDEASFRDDETTRKYIDSAISRNIQHTLKYDHDGEYFNELEELYRKNLLTNVINRIVENMNHEFVLDVVTEQFKSHDLGSTKNLLLHEAPQDSAYVLYNIDKTSVVKRLKELIDIKEYENIDVHITQEIIEKLKKYLKLLDLIVDCPDIYESGARKEHYIFTQAGMRYAIAKALIYSLLQDSIFADQLEETKQYVINKLLEDVKGRMLEEIILLDTCKVLNKFNGQHHDTLKKAFKFKFSQGGEYDMVVYDGTTNTCQLYEIKHSDKVVEQQTRYLLNEEYCNIIQRRYGMITDKIVLYRGESKMIGDITYKNVEEYLIELRQ